MKIGKLRQVNGFWKILAFAEFVTFAANSVKAKSWYGEGMDLVRSRYSLCRKKEILF